MKSRRFDVWQVISFVILGLYALFLILPLGRLLLNSFLDSDGNFSVVHFQEFFGSMKKLVG